MRASLVLVHECLRMRREKRLSVGVCAHRHTRTLPTHHHTALAACSARRAASRVAATSRANLATSRSGASTSDRFMASSSSSTNCMCVDDGGTRQTRAIRLRQTPCRDAHTPAAAAPADATPALRTSPPHVLLTFSCRRWRNSAPLRRQRSRRGQRRTHARSARAHLRRRQLPSYRDSMQRRRRDDAAKLFGGLVLEQQAADIVVGVRQAKLEGSAQRRQVVEYGSAFRICQHVHMR